MRAQQSVSIFAVVYRSIEYAEHISDAVRRYTPELSNGQAEFFLVANSPTPKLGTWLDSSGIPFVKFSYVGEESEMDCGPEYLRSVYAAYNFGLSRAKNDAVVMLNSDMVPAPGWLSALLETYDGSNLVSPILVEPFHPRHGVFPGAIAADFGSTPKMFDYHGWEQFVSAQPDTSPGELKPPYMPVLVSKSRFLREGGFPEGNKRQPDGTCRAADELFYEALATHGMEHRLSRVPAFVYHFKEGEKRTEGAFRFFSFTLPRALRRLGVVWLLNKLLLRT